MKILFITDGSKAMGMGHVYRSIFIAKELGQNEIIIATKSDEKVIEKINKHRIQTIHCGTDKEIAQIKSDVCIVDRLNIEYDYAKELKKNTGKLILIENLIKESNDICDISINPILCDGINKHYFRDGVEYFEGVKYLFLKDDFFIKKEKRNDTIKTILIMFGATDPAGLTGKVCNVLNGYHVNIIGNYYNAKHDIDNVADFMRVVDLVITHPGITLFEALSIGTSVIAVHQNEWQAGWFKPYFHTLNEYQIIAIPGIIENREYTDPENEDVKKMEIGKGKQELLTAILRSRNETD